MHNSNRMHVIQPSQNLIHEHLKMLSRQFLLASQNLVQVSIHELEHNINMVKVLSGHWHLNRFEVDYVLVF
jgi:hypothetical protein